MKLMSVWILVLTVTVCGCALFGSNSKTATDAENAVACVVDEIVKGDTDASTIVVTCSKFEAQLVVDAIAMLLDSTSFKAAHPEATKALSASFAAKRGTLAPASSASH